MDGEMESEAGRGIVLGARRGGGGERDLKLEV